MSEERDNRLMKELVEQMPNPWAGEIGGNRKQMFSGNIPLLDEVLKEPLPEGVKVKFRPNDRLHGAFGKHADISSVIQQKLVDAVGLPPSLISDGMSEEIAKRVQANTDYMRMGLKIQRAVSRKATNEFHRAADMQDNRDYLLTRLRETPVRCLPAFSKQLDLWVQTAFATALEFFHRVADNRNFHRTFVERKLDVFTSNDGWEIAAQRAVDKKIWVLRDPQGRDDDAVEWLHEFSDKYPYEFITYEHRYGRTGYTEMDIKYGPAHFPKGTVVEVYHDMMKSPEQFTVDYITTIGARNWVLTFQECKGEDEGHLAGNPEEFNVHHVRKIIKRGTGPIIVKDDFPEYTPIEVQKLVETERANIAEFAMENHVILPRLKKDEALIVNHHRLISCILDMIGRQPDNQGKWIDEGKLYRYMREKQFGRLVTLHSVDGETWESFYIFNIKKMTAWMHDHQHQLFMTLRRTQKLEEDLDRKQSAELVW